MRIKVTKPGIYVSNGTEIEVGTELTVSAEPTGWAGRYEVISGGDDGKTAVLNPNDAPSERDELKKQAAELGIEYPKNISTDKLKELIDAKLAA